MNGLNLNGTQQDCLQELINIAMGQASDHLARYLDTFIELQIPSIESIDANSLFETLNQDHHTTAIVSQGFFANEGIRGEALLLFNEEKIGRITELLGFEPDELSADEQLIDISSILTTTFLNGFAQQIESQMSYNAPKLLPDVADSICEHLQQMTFNWQHALKVNIYYKISDYAFTCNMVLLIPEKAIINITHVLDKLMEEYND